MASSIVTNDGVRIAYEKRGTRGQNIVLLHGWSGSRRYFDLNIEGLSKHMQVFAMDLRFHGDSDKPAWGFHVSRLAADLRDFLEALDLTDVVVVGTSLGCAVIWSYIELFGESRLGKCIFVDQAPLQYSAPDWKLGSKGLPDAASLAGLQAKLRDDFNGFAAGNAECCLSKELAPEVVGMLINETKRCSGGALGALMADHTQLDWRPVLPRISLPCLVLGGRKSGCFPWEGVAYVGEAIPNAKTIFFEECNHWLHLEEPDNFNQAVLDFCL